jgi:hypothetical protein
LGREAGLAALLEARRDRELRPAASGKVMVGRVDRSDAGAAYAGTLHCLPDSCLGS